MAAIKNVAVQMDHISTVKIGGDSMEKRDFVRGFACNGVEERDFEIDEKRCVCRRRCIRTPTSGG